MRERKYRAWNTGTKTMLYFTLEELGTGMDRKFLYLRKQNIVMDFTGLKDVENKDIYEGDIFDTPSGIKYYVDFIYGKYVIKGIYDDDGEHYTEDIYRISRQWKIVGNKYQNPEMLK